MNREKGKPAKSPFDFHPYAVKPTPKARQATQADLDMLFGGSP